MTYMVLKLKRSLPFMAVTSFKDIIQSQLLLGARFQDSTLLFPDYIPPKISPPFL